MSTTTCPHASSGCDYPTGECSGACVSKAAKAKAPSDAERYTRAMIDSDLTTLVRIEQKHNLYGYPPEIVSVGLHAVAEGKNAREAIDAYLAGEQS
ncbi:hypothetical protein [Cupriavidus metallidurans]|uniref:hypothetical protein n=1 Tax=Cupriavidus metallidurans TaxID=119219 RepID=UPI001319E41F|nr:hypothetical protein [Cupriavidus metallidurans]